MSSPREVAERALARHPLLQGLEPEVRARFLTDGEVVVYAPGEFLSREGDPSAFYWLLCSGSVRVFYASPEGFEVTVKIFAAPAAWAEMELLTGHAHIEDCVAVDRSVVVRVPKVPFEKLLQDSPKLMRNVLYDTCARFLIAAQHERALAFLPVEKRLANLLLTYVRMFGVPVEGGLGIRVKLSQSELANGLGVARRSIARTLTQWVKQGLLKKAGTSYVVRDLPGLAKFANQELVGIDWVAGSDIQTSKALGPRSRG
ncbi:MAG: Crp/Fnr family transcriptional regulator [Archangiaceae bacterium]|nr:Crp/Fnr family transcriptional regulator [Archangiaceae bacterium]